MAHILLIDDDPAILRVQEALLSREGHQVATAGNGKEALPHLRGTAFDLVITDLIMPEREGMETIQLLRREYPKTKIIASSGGGRADATDYLNMARLMGANAILPKPFTREELLAAIAQALG